MTYVFVCPECGERADVSGGLEVRKVPMFCSGGDQMKRDYKLEKANVATVVLKNQREHGR